MVEYHKERLFDTNSLSFFYRTRLTTDAPVSCLSEKVVPNVPLQIGWPYQTKKRNRTVIQR